MEKRGGEREGWVEIDTGDSEAVKGGKRQDNRE